MILVVAGALTWVLSHEIGEWASLVPLIVGHFFLFCNVFRVGTKRELIWALAFILNFAAWILFGGFSPLVLGPSQAPFTLLVIFLTVRSPDYHGFGCGWLEKTQTIKISRNEAPLN